MDVYFPILNVPRILLSRGQCQKNQIHSYSNFKKQFSSELYTKFRVIGSTQCTYLNKRLQLVFKLESRDQTQISFADLSKVSLYTHKAASTLKNSLKRRLKELFCSRMTCILSDFFQAPAEQLRSNFGQTVDENHHCTVVYF